MSSDAVLGRQRCGLVVGSAFGVAAGRNLANVGAIASTVADAYAISLPA